MTRSINAKTSSVTKGMNKKREVKDKTRGQSGTHRLKQLDNKRGENIVDEVKVVENVSWFRRMFQR